MDFTEDLSKKKNNKKSWSRYYAKCCRQFPRYSLKNLIDVPYAHMCIKDIPPARVFIPRIGKYVSLSPLGWYVDREYTQ